MHYYIFRIDLYQIKCIVSNIWQDISFKLMISTNFILKMYKWCLCVSRLSGRSYHSFNVYNIYYYFK